MCVVFNQQPFCVRTVSHPPGKARRQRLHNEVGDGLWLRYVDRVTAFHFDDSRTGAFRHRALGVRRRRNAVPETQAGTAITRSSVFGKRVVRIAIEPALTRLRRCDNRMPRRASVLRRVTVGRVVAAMRATALLTGTEMNPGSAHLDALLALPSFWVLDAGNGIDVGTTLIGHGISQGRST